MDGVDSRREAFEVSAQLSCSEPEHSGGDCCRTDPFCEAHGDMGTSVFYLVRVDRTRRVVAGVHSDGVCVRDSWRLGPLDGLPNVLIRYLLTSCVEGEMRGEGSSSPSSSEDSSSEEELWRCSRRRRERAERARAERQSGDHSQERSEEAALCEGVAALRSYGGCTSR